MPKKRFFWKPSKTTPILPQSTKMFENSLPVLLIESNGCPATKSAVIVEEKVCYFLGVDLFEFATITELTCLIKQLLLSWPAWLSNFYWTNLFDLATFTELTCLIYRCGMIQYLADPIGITIHDTRSDAYHDTLIFHKNL